MANHLPPSDSAPNASDRTRLPRTIVAGIDIPFLDLVVLYIKMMFAALPAALIAAIIFAIGAAIVNG